MKGFYETSNGIDFFAVVDAGANAPHGARYPTESESGAEYSGSAADTSTEPEYSRLAEFSRTACAECTDRSGAAAKYSCTSYGSGATTTDSDSLAALTGAYATAK